MATKAKKTVKQPKTLLLPLLKKLGACTNAQEWARRRYVSKSTYDACPNDRWLGWLAGSLGVKGKLGPCEIDPQIKRCAACGEARGMYPYPRVEKALLAYAEKLKKDAKRSQKRK